MITTLSKRANYLPLTPTTLETLSIDVVQPNLPQRRSLYTCGYHPTQTRQGLWWSPELDSGCTAIGAEYSLDSEACASR